MSFRYATRKPDGALCCAGDEPDFPRCPRCRAQHVGEPTLRSAENYNPPDPWEHDLAKQRPRDTPAPAPAPAPEAREPGDFSAPDPYEHAIREHLDREARERRNR